MNEKRRQSKPASTKKSNKRDDFKSVARRLGADEDKERFESNLKKIAKSKAQSDK